MMLVARCGELHSGEASKIRLFEGGDCVVRDYFF